MTMTCLKCGLTAPGQPTACPKCGAVYAKVEAAVASPSAAAAMPASSGRPTAPIPPLAAVIPLPPLTLYKPGAGKKITLFIFSGLAFVIGLGFFLGAKSAIHEIEGLVSMLAAAVLFSAAAIVEAINEAHGGALDVGRRQDEVARHIAARTTSQGR